MQGFCCRRNHRWSRGGVHDAHEPRKLTAPAASTRRRALSTCARSGYDRYGIHGEVYLWGTVVEHERGWRAQFAYPKNLFLSPDVTAVRREGNGVPLGALAAYGSDIFVLGDGQNIPLCRQGLRASTRRDWTT